MTGRTSDERERLEGPAGPPRDGTFEQAPVGMAHLSPDGRWLRVNRRLCEMLGYAPEELLGRGRDIVSDPRDLRAEAECAARMLAGETRPCHLEQRYRTRDGSTIWVEVLISAARSGMTPEPDHLIYLVQDVTARRQALVRLQVQHVVSRALAESETVQEVLPRLLDAVGRQLEWSAGAVWTVDSESDVLRCSAFWSADGDAFPEFERATREIALGRGMGLPGRVWQTAAAVWIANLGGERNLPRLNQAAHEGLRGAFAFPILQGGEVLGVMEYFSEQPVPADESLLAAAEGVGLQIGQFVARRRAAEAELVARARNATVIETALDCIISIDHEGNVVEFNPAAEATFGYRRADVLGQPLADLIIPPELREAHWRGLERYLATGEARVLGRRLELPAVRADGSRIEVELAITRVPLPGPAVFTAYLRDLTERKRLERWQRLLLDASSLLGSSLDYERTLRNLSTIVVPAMADWYAVDVLMPDRTLRRLEVAHRDPERVALARTLGERYPTRLEDDYGVARALRTGESELRHDIPDEFLASAARDSEHLELLRQLGLRSYMVVPLRGRGGVLGAITMVTAESARRYVEQDLEFAEELARRATQAIENARLYSDLAEARQQLEEQAAELEMQTEELQATAAELEEANTELRESNRLLNEQRLIAEHAGAEADRANRAKSQFLATMSHELRTPLNAIIGYSQLLLEEVRGPLSTAQGEDLRRIMRSARLLLGLITDILNFAKIEAGRVQYDLRDVLVNSMLSDVGELIAPQARTRSVTYEYRAGDPGITVRADRDKLLQIVLNLLSNAVRFTREGGVVIVDWTAGRENVEIRVCDTGMGIPPENLESIFEPFTQIGRTYAGERQGTGLGLAISRELARAMGGEVTARSTPGEGSTFILTLPRGDQAPAPTQGRDR